MLELRGSSNVSLSAVASTSCRSLSAYSRTTSLPTLFQELGLHDVDMRAALRLDRLQTGPVFHI